MNDDQLRDSCSMGADCLLRLQFGLFHGDPHPGNIFALRDGRIAYVDFGNVAELSQRNKAILIDAVVHAVNNDYESMAQDFIKLVGFYSVGSQPAESLLPRRHACYPHAWQALMLYCRAVRMNTCKTSLCTAHCSFSCTCRNLSSVLITVEATLI